MRSISVACPFFKLVIFRNTKDSERFFHDIAPVAKAKISSLRCHSKNWKFAEHCLSPHSGNHPSSLHVRIKHSKRKKFIDRGGLKITLLKFNHLFFKGITSCEAEKSGLNLSYPWPHLKMRQRNRMTNYSINLVVLSEVHQFCKKKIAI